MTLHPLLAAEIIAFGTILVPKDQIRTAIKIETAQWAGVEYDPALEDEENIAYNDCDKIKYHEYVIKDFVDCIRLMMLKQNHSAEEIWLSTFKRKKQSPTFKQLTQCYKQFMIGNNYCINSYANYLKFGHDPELHEYYLNVKLENKDLLKSLGCVSPEVFLEYRDLSRETDNTLFVNNAMQIMTQAKHKNMPSGYRYDA